MGSCGPQQQMVPKLLRAQKKALMPHEVWQIIKNFSDSQGLAQDCVDACKFVMDWCVVAAQATAPEKDSFLAFGLDSVTEQDNDVSLAGWLESCLDTTVGRQPAHGGHQGLPGNHQPNQAILRWTQRSSLRRSVKELP